MVKVRTRYGVRHLRATRSALAWLKHVIRLQAEIEVRDQKIKNLQADVAYYRSEALAGWRERED